MSRNNRIMTRDQVLQLAFEAGCSGKWLYKILSGRARNPSRDLCERLAVKLPGTTPEMWWRAGEWRDQIAASARRRWHT